MWRVLICRPDHIGDVLLTLPAVMHLRRALPTAEITFVVPPGSAEVPRHCPAVDETLTVPFPSLGANDTLREWLPRVATEAERLKGRFDIALLPRPDDPWSGSLVATAGIPVRIGYAAPRTSPYLTTELPLPAIEPVSETARRTVIAGLQSLGIRAKQPTGTLTSRVFVPTSAEEAEAEAVLRSLGLDTIAPLVLHPGSSWPLKNWLDERWAELARRLSSDYGAPVLITGSARERAMIEALAVASQASAISLAGRLSLGGLSALFSRARVVIATDSGPMHLAALADAPVVGLFGPADPALFAPLAPAGRSRVVRIKLPCSPCGTLIDPPCGATTAPRCVTGISVDTVLAAVKELNVLSSLVALPDSASDVAGEPLGW